MKTFARIVVPAIAFLLAVGLGTSIAISATVPESTAAAPAIEASSDIPGCGAVIFTELFDDASFEGRRWYDGAAGEIDEAEHIGGSRASFRCDFEPGRPSCTGGKPSRHAIRPTETLYLGFHVKFGVDWIGSGKPYHPHLFNVLTNQDGDWIGPSATHLTVYAEIVDGHPTLAIQDALNVDPACLLLGTGSTRGCNGDFGSYAFTEHRSVAGCNGRGSGLGRIDCYAAGDDWYSYTQWRSPAITFGELPDRYDQTDWHFVEVYLELNRIESGVGIANGKIRWVQDGELILASDEILFRTGVHPEMKFDQLTLLPYIGEGSPRKQRMWIDNLTVATARPGPCR